MDSVFRIAVGLLLILCGIGWAGLSIAGSMMADAPSSGTLQSVLVGAGVAVVGIGIMCLPLIIR